MFNTIIGILGGIIGLLFGAVIGLMIAAFILQRHNDQGNSKGVASDFATKVNIIPIALDKYISEQYTRDPGFHYKE